MNNWLEFLDNFSNMYFIFQGVVNYHAEEFGVCCFFNFRVTNLNFDFFGNFWFVKDGVVGFGWVRDKVIGVEVLNEAR